MTGVSMKYNNTGLWNGSNKMIWETYKQYMQSDLGN